ncbi:MAG: orotate phosphoribosyltransferase [Helicobacteraceae bacterium]|jgi:orotate phosphoribosyltransferase|nr:orotate phosphoribosyltransferase [Helicobacteraceae bacterium]
MDVEAIYKSADAILTGHFLLSSGAHSGYYLQSAKALEDPKTAEKLARALAEQIRAAAVEAQVVCAPALGGILAGYELARALGVRSVFTERVEGQMTLRRGFEIAKGEKVIVCEDIITTGGSAAECAKAIEERGGEIVAFAALANRGFCRRVGGVAGDDTCKLPPNKPFFALADFDFPIYPPDKCPLCAKYGKPIKPGSRPSAA